MTTAGLILAAGASRRLGQPKQLLLHRGKPLVVHAIEQALLAGCTRVVVVTGSSGSQVAEAIAHASLCHVQALHNELWDEGQGTSLAAGAAALLNDPAMTEALVMLCDQPLMDHDQLRQLIQTVRSAETSIAAACYPEGGGVPACFSRRCMKSLRRLRGDQGAKQLIRGGAFATRLIPIQGIQTDIDTPADLNRLRPQREV